MNIAIVTNMNGIGLQRDYELLNGYLRDELHHSVAGIQFDDAREMGDNIYDLAIYLEVAPRSLMNISERRWAFLNPDWCKPDVIQVVDRSFEKIFAKTREGQRIFEELFPGRVHYTGFMARDQYEKRITRRPWFLHVGGNSSLRGTETVLDAWRWRKNGKSIESTLILISSTVKDEDLPPHVRLYDHVDEEELKVYQNECMFHLYPSGTEGWGHALHEALSVGACIITTGRPPMSEIDGCYYLESKRASKYNLADVWEVDALEIIEAVECVGKMKAADIDSARMRKQFLDGNESFKKLFAPHLEEPVAVAVPALIRGPKTGRSVAFIGNFAAEHSTENQIKWALTERLGFQVETLQEDKVDFNAVREAAVYNDALIWVRTPGWLQISDSNMENILLELKEREIPSISIHLDKFWGIPEREQRIGKDAFWKTQFVWTADGGHDEDFRLRGVNHYWMRPAVSEVYCHPGTPRDQHRCDVLFVGAREYHPEYPFRPMLVDFLRREYGDRFHHVTGIRGHDLNDVYASAKVVIGDCIFAGTPYYWSDRVPETCGRGGLLLHPSVMGFDYPVPTYKPQDLGDLKNHIDAALAITQAHRNLVRARCLAYVMKNDTWTRRMERIFDEARVGVCDAEVQ